MAEALPVKPSNDVLNESLFPRSSRTIEPQLLLVAARRLISPRTLAFHDPCIQFTWPIAFKPIGSLQPQQPGGRLQVSRGRGAHSATASQGPRLVGGRTGRPANSLDDTGRVPVGEVVRPRACRVSGGRAASPKKTGVSKLPPRLKLRLSQGLTPTRSHPRAVAFFES